MSYYSSTIVPSSPAYCTFARNWRKTSPFTFFFGFPFVWGRFVRRTNQLRERLHSPVITEKLLLQLNIRSINETKIVDFQEIDERTKKNTKTHEIFQPKRKIFFVRTLAVISCHRSLHEHTENYGRRKSKNREREKKKSKNRIKSVKCLKQSANDQTN